MLNYARTSSYTDAELIEDNRRIRKNQQEFIATGKFFIIGVSTGLVLSPRVVFADDAPTSMAKSTAKKELAKRVSNTAACTAILSVCSKVAAKNPDKVDAAAKSVLTNPQVAAAFGCGLAVAWCAKYAIFDR